MTSVPDWLGRRARTHARALALHADGLTLSFAELDEAVSVAARRLAGSGVEPGQRVALLAHNGAGFAIAAHAVGRLGAVLVPLNVRLTPAELVRQLVDAAPCLLLVGEGCAGTGGSVAAALPALAQEPIGVLGPLGDERAVALRTRIDLGEPHSVIYTSGTAGAPKGAVLSWGNFWWSAVGSALTLGHVDGDRWLAPLPLFHVGGLSILMRGAIGGIAALVQPRFDPPLANAAIDDGGATIVSLVAVMLQRMLDARGERGFPPTLRCVLLGGGPVAQPLLERCAALEIPVALSYGLTESTSQAVTLPPQRALAKLGSCGYALPPTDLRIERDGAAVPAGEVGEIVLRGPTIARAYLNRPEDTERAWRGGWFHTGDLGRLDDDGCLYVLDRRDDLIVSGGENVYPAEVESALARHPAVEEAGVIGVADAVWGRVPLAIVRLRAGAGANADELLAHCARELAAYKRPKAIRFAAAPLPRNAAGKLLRRELRAGDGDDRSA